MTHKTWIDIHCHLDMLEDPKEAVSKAKKCGVEKIITISTNPASQKKVLDFAGSFPNVFCTLGIHPHDAKDFNIEVKKYILKNAHIKKCVAIGEIGLDYYYNHSEPSVQQKVFFEQLEMAQELNLPVQIHTRDAEKDTIDILKKFKPKGVIHCFTGTQWLADEALSLGMNISFSGIVTFKKANEIQAVAKNTPIDRMHIETDAPFLAPVPMRGKKNVPANIPYIGGFLSTLKGIDTEELKKILWKNSISTFPKTQL